MVAPNTKTGARIRRLGWLTTLMLACSGCFSGQGPSASRIRPDTNDRYLPHGEIYFVEHGHRSKGVLVAATPGFKNAFSATWTTKLVPTSPTALAGPALPDGSNGELGADQALAIARLPKHRNAFYLGLYGGSARFRFRELSVWVLSTDPLVVGLPAGEPKRSWREFAAAETGIKDPAQASPVDPVLVRFAVKGELDQPLSRIAVFPKDFWNQTDAGDTARVELSLVTLPQAMPVGEVLDRLTAGDPTQLGTLETVPLHENFESGRENARNRIADRERLLAQ